MIEDFKEEIEEDVEENIDKDVDKFDLFSERKHHSFVLPKSVTEVELRSHPKIMEACLIYGFDSVLYNVFGLKKIEGDLKYTIERHDYKDSKGVLHKNVIFFIGESRLDDDWIKNGNPTDEEKIAAKRDYSLIAQLNSIGRQIRS